MLPYSNIHLISYESFFTFSSQGQSPTTFVTESLWYWKRGALNLFEVSAEVTSKAALSGICKLWYDDVASYLGVEMIDCSLLSVNRFHIFHLRKITYFLIVTTLLSFLTRGVSEEGRRTWSDLLYKCWFYWVIENQAEHLQQRNAEPWLRYHIENVRESLKLGTAFT